MKLAIGSDHAAYESKNKLTKFLESLGHEVQDLGTNSNESCDFPDYAAEVSKLVQAKSVERGILICGTGIGMSIASNRFSGVRAALCNTEELALLSRQHNDANVLCMGARTQSQSSMESILTIWLNATWEGGRHAIRVQKIETNSRG